MTSTLRGFAEIQQEAIAFRSSLTAYRRNLKANLHRHRALDATYPTRNGSSVEDVLEEIWFNGCPKVLWCTWTRQNSAVRSCWHQILPKLRLIFDAAVCSPSLDSRVSMPDAGPWKYGPAETRLQDGKTSATFSKKDDTSTRMTTLRICGICINLSLVACMMLAASVWSTAACFH